MQFSIAKDIFGSPWQISAQGIMQYWPLVERTFNGGNIIVEAEPEENIPFNVSANTYNIIENSSHDNDDEEYNEEEDTKEKVVHVMPVRGILMKNDMACGPRGSKTLASRLLNADKDESVIGHIMIVEGPGGASNAVPPLAEAIKNCKKPIIAWVEDMAASAHQYVISYAKEVYASKESDILGSIGTLISYRGRKSKSEEDLYKEIEVTIYADEAFEKNQEYEEAINNFNFKPAKENILNPHNKKFVEDMKANRPGVEDKHLHGKVFAAKDVVGSLIDGIKSFNDTVKRLIEISDFSETKEDTQETQTTKNNDMSKKIKLDQFSNIDSVIEGFTSFESTEEGVFLNEEQISAVNAALGKQEDDASSAQALQASIDKAIASLDAISENVKSAEGLENKLTEVGKAFQNLTTEQSSATKAVSDAINALDEIGDSVQKAEGISAKVQEIKEIIAKQPGTSADSSKKNSNGNSGTGADGVDWETIEALPHNKEE
jgi:protease-4